MALAITPTQQQQIVRLVVGMFNAAPGATYLDEIAAVFQANGQNLSALATSLSATNAFHSIYSSGMTSPNFATAFLTTLGLQGNTEAVAFITSKDTLGVESRGQIILDAINALEGSTSPTFAAAKAMLDNKTQVALFYSVSPLHVAETSLGVLQNVLSTITADHATVVAEEAVLSFVPPLTFNLTPNTDVVNPASGVNSTVTGTADTGGTFTTGDIITGNATTVFNLTVNGTPPSLATVSNVGTVNINAIATSTVNADLWSGIGLVDLVAPTLPGTVTTLSNAQVATTYGITGNASSLTVGFRDTTGAADTAHGLLNGAGTSATVFSTLDLSSANSVEALTLATGGTNFATVNGGTADKSITITGAGVNTLTFGATAATLTVDASTTTGAQKLTFVPGSIGAEDTIKGGSAADTVTANVSTTFAHMTGVETFVTTVNGGVALYDGANVTGLTTMTINQGSAAGAEFFSNMKAEFSTLNINGPTLSQDVNYVTNANATLAVNYGPGSTAFDTTFDGLSVDEVQSLTVTLNVGGIAGVAMGSGTIDLDKADTSSLTLIQAGSDDSVYLTVDKADALDNLVIRATGDNSSIGVQMSFNANVDVQGLQTLEITASGINSEAYLNDWEGISGWNTLGSGATNSVTSTTNAMSLTNVNITASGNSSSAYMNTYIVNVGDVAEFNITASGNSSDAYMNYTWVNVGDVGTINVVASGNTSDAYFSSYVSVFDGNVGTINVTASGNDSTASFDSTLYIYRGDLGTVNITASGNDSNASMYEISTWGGDVGAINITASNNGAWASLDYLYVNTGNVGSVTLTASGASSSAYMDSMYVYSGDVGSISLVASGDLAKAYGYTVSIYGDLGAWSLLASGDSASAYQELSYVSGDIGTMSIVASGDSANAYLYTSLVVDGDVGSLTVTASGASADASFDNYFMTVGGNLGPVNVTASGQDSWASMNAYVSGSVPSVTVTASGADSSASVEIYNNDGSMNLLSLAVNSTGASSWVGAYVDTGSGILGNVTIQATKANSSATLDFTGNTFGTIAATSGSPSASIDLLLDNTTTAGGVITSSGSGTLYVDIQGKSITSLLASGQTNAVTVVVDTVVSFVGDAIATAAMTLTTGSFADNVQGGTGVDTFSLGGGADVFNFTNIADVTTVASAATDIVAGGFASGTDKFDFNGTAGSGTSYTENLTAAASLAALITAADTALNGTVQYYFGVFGTDGYLAADLDGTGVTHLIKLTGILDMAAADIQA